MTEHDITLTVNGTEHDLTVEARTLLAHVLRDDLGYTGTNVGCESSLCGACTVRIDGDAVKSCTALAVQVDGAEIETVEGLAHDGELHPIQKGFQEEHGLQCGFCTPGMMMTAVELLEENPNPTRDEIREGLEGNLCRCTGYQNIVNAVQNAAESMGSGAVADGGAVEEGGEGR
jgi:carbon-monoxide dehydrogenase small subunit